MLARSRSGSPDRSLQRRVSSYNAARLCDAAMSSDSDLVRDILDVADPNRPDDDGRLAIYSAAFSGSVQIVSELIEANASVNCPEKERDGGLPIQIASWMGHAEVVKLLTASAANVNIADGRGCTPLCSAAEQGHDSAVAVLINHGADITKKGAVGQHRTMLTPLQAALASRNSKCVQMLSSGKTSAGSFRSNPGVADPQKKTWYVRFISCCSF